MYTEINYSNCIYLSFETWMYSSLFKMSSDNVGGPSLMIYIIFWDSLLLRQASALKVPQHPKNTKSLSRDIIYASLVWQQDISILDCMLITVIVSTNTAMLICMLMEPSVAQTLLSFNLFLPLAGATINKISYDLLHLVQWVMETHLVSVLFTDTCVCNECLCARLLSYLPCYQL